MFPLTTTFIKRSDVPNSRLPALVKVIERELIDRSARSMMLTANTIEFRGGIFRLVTNLNLLVTISRGKILCGESTDGIIVTSELHYTGLLILSLAVGLLFAFYPPASIGSRIETRAAAFIVVVVWVYGTNALLNFLRFRNFISDCLDETRVT